MGEEKVVEDGEKKEKLSRTSTEKKGKKWIIYRIWNGIFRSRKDDFEKRLEYISKEEGAVMGRIKKREFSWRRTSRQLIAFSVIFEVIAIGYAFMTTRTMDMNWKGRAIRVLPMFLLPALSTAVYITFVSFIGMCDRRDQKILEKLRAERKAKINELKEKTNYYTTQQLIQRYDTDPAAKAAAASVLASKLGADSGLKVYLGDESKPGAPTEKSNNVELVKSNGLRNRKQVQSRSISPGMTTPNHSDKELVGSRGIDQTQTSNHSDRLVVEHHRPQSSTANGGGWTARIAAMLVGEDPTLSYALICGSCHMHNVAIIDVFSFIVGKCDRRSCYYGYNCDCGPFFNNHDIVTAITIVGLARKEDFPFITYYCPHCHALNKPKQSDERSISGLNSPNKDVGEVVKDATASAVDNIISSNSSTNACPEVEEVSESTNLVEKAS